MARNWINNGHSVPVNHTSALVSGKVAVIGSLIGIADRTSAVGEDNEIHRTGNWKLPKVAGALAVGADYKVDISDLDNITHSIAAASSTVIVIGVVSRDAIDTDTTVDVVIK